MRILLLSNQGMVEPFIGNPIMLRYRDALLADNRVDEVKMLRCSRPLKVINELRHNARNVDIIHVHFGGLYALLVWFLIIDIKKPKFITFHGTDIHAKALKTTNNLAIKIKIKLNQYASFISILCYTKCGFVAKEMKDYVPGVLKRIMGKKSFIQPLGVDYHIFSLLTIDEAQSRLGIQPKKYILFSDVSNSSIKRRDIATAIVQRLPGYHLLIMCGVNPSEVPLYINSSECILLTSDQEGSPNIIREALSLNKPVFSVDVGDAAEQLRGLTNSTIISRNPDIAAAKIREYLNKPYIDNTRYSKREILDFSLCSKSIIDMYSINC